MHINTQKFIRIAAIGVIAIGAIAFFGYQLYRNMGKGSKASASGTVTINLSSDHTGPISPGTVFTIGVTLSANSGNKMSAVDLYFTDPQDALDFVDDSSFSWEEQSTKAFDEEVTKKITVRTNSDGSKRLDRLVLVAKRATASLKTTSTIRLRFKSRGTTAFSYPSTVNFGINTGSSIITGPGINNNKFGLTPVNASIAISLACSGTATCTAGQVCYQSNCRLYCSDEVQCTGQYHCENGACMPGTGGGGSSSSAGQVPTATPYPTARPDKANLFLKVKMPDIDRGVMVAETRILIKELASSLTVNLFRQPGTDMFQTNAPLELDIPADRPGTYTLLIKQLKTTQRSFSVYLERGDTKNCIAGDSSCVGSLKNPELAPLLSGDSDGFNDGSDGSTNSPSFNKINNVDLEKLVEQYGTTVSAGEANADFNLDGKVDVNDLGILGKNYNKTGE